MSSLIWHPDALDDVARLYDFLFPHSPEAARRAASVILEAADLIAENLGSALLIWSSASGPRSLAVAPTF
ncbi:type II toxin-antitoxin system RelE/ParE family toxin [Trinickia terrae]|uniref:type II toxin-antitoxin system RelE/ParE family toxin n=1 Tax=Trinickia terrae TaxID=2571161 RepID=UPI001F0F69E6|nr:type II toxin-antitoxin system RelE/ParE family toxin [Trinickia terrae]